MVGEPPELAHARWIVILGAAVWQGGVASPALRRRVAAAVAVAREAPHARLLPTGAIGRHPPSEAAVMRALLIAAGIGAHRVELEERGTDTLSSLRHCARIVRASGGGPVYLCTDAYHLPRCRAIAWALGLPAESIAAHGARCTLGPRRFAFAVLREIAATPWDVLLALAARLRD